MAGNTASLGSSFKARAGKPTGGTASFSGTGAQSVYNIAHGQGATPNHWFAVPVSDKAFGKRTVTVTATNIVIAGTNNLVYRWGASKL